jgi:hypothetical protein
MKPRDGLGAAHEFDQQALLEFRRGGGQGGLSEVPGEFVIGDDAGIPRLQRRGWRLALTLTLILPLPLPLTLTLTAAAAAAMAACRW